ncbi:MAG: O-antigen ligase family protein [Roseibacillus sp.]|nr:O-antigen ligase family protein [Roseibacillus sp.]
MSDHPVQTRSVRVHWLAPTALLFLFAGWVTAILLAGGLELHRSAVAMPLVVIGALLGLAEAVRTRRVVRTPILLAGVPALLYFILRALFSEVWDLGRHDLHLITMAWLTIVTVPTCVGTRRERIILLAGLAVVFGAQFLAGLYQQFFDPHFTFFRRTRPSGEGVSGLFWQWNNLAGLLAIMVPLFLGVALCSPRWRTRVPFLLLAGAGLLLAWLTKSRAGFAATVGGLGCAVALVVLARVHRRSPGARLAAWSVLGVLALGAMGAVVLATSALSEQRDQGSDLGNLLGSSSRLGLAGVAFEIWQEKPLLGNGSQSYRYLAIQHWDTDIPSWVDDPELAHSEYLQVLCDYGLIGLVLILGFLIVVLLSALLPSPQRGEDPPSLQRGLQVGAAAGLVGAMLHAAFDFQPHLLPILMMASLAIGLVMPAASPTRSILAQGGHVTLVIVISLLAVVAVGKESLHAGGWIQWEQQRGANFEVDPGELPRLRKLVEDSPHYFAAEMYGRLQLSAYTQTPEADRPENVFRLEEARWGLELAHERHPEDPRSLIELGLVLDLLGEFDQAAGVHVEAIRVARRRERKFGAYAGLSLHLALRGKQLWYSRRPEEAFGCFLRAQEYLDLSIRRGYRFSRPQEFRERRTILEFYIKSLQDGKIRPEFPPEILIRFPQPDDPTTR